MAQRTLSKDEFHELDRVWYLIPEDELYEYNASVKIARHHFWPEEKTYSEWEWGDCVPIVPSAGGAVHDFAYPENSQPVYVRAREKDNQ